LEWRVVATDNDRLSAREDSSAATAALYERIYGSSVDEDAWHAHSTRVIATFIGDALRRLRPNRSLDVGCGVWRYVAGVRPFLLDLVPSVFVPGEAAVVGDVTSLPFKAAEIDLAVCVGSVLNYVNAQHCIDEISRVVRPGGTLVLEYERSGRGARRRSTEPDAENCTEVVSYRGIVHTITLYTDRHIEELLDAKGFRVVRRQPYHIFSSVALLFTRSEERAAGLTRLDRSPLARVLAPFAANVILECVKRPLHRLGRRAPARSS
jgi:SAM-dependent methyltransferase